MIGEFVPLSPHITILTLWNREYIVQEDLTKAARKVGEAKKHEGMSTFLYS